MVTYAKGLVRPANIDELHAKSWDKYKKHLAVLPQDIPSSWDWRTRGIIGAVKDQANCGCEKADDEVLTSKGWVRWDQYDWETPLGTMEPETGLLEFQPCLQKHEYDYEGLMYNYKNCCLNFSLTPNHRMYVRKWNERNRTLSDDFSFTSIENIGWYAGLPYATTGFIGTELKTLGIGNREYEGNDLLALIALIISDGWVGDSENTSTRVGFCCFREDRLEMVHKLANKLSLKESPSRKGYWEFHDKHLNEWFKMNAFTSNNYFTSPYKRVPDLVKVATSEQIIHFLNYFGDQHTEPDGETRRFYSTSKRMMDDVQELLLRMGKRGTLKCRKARGKSITSDGRTINNLLDCYEITERKTTRLSIEKKQNITTEEYKGKVYCATVPNGLLVTRREGTILVSGNSCWNFSGTGTVESALVLGGVGNASEIVLSEQYTMDCGRNGGCNGDDNSTVLDWAKKTGLPLSKDYGPYQADSGQCKSSGYKLYQISDWGYADKDSGVSDTTLVKSAMMKFGAIGAAIAADNEFMNAPSGEVFMGSGSTDIDHDIILVGWGDTSTKVSLYVGSGLTKTTSAGYWWLRNSWSTSWNTQGYMRIAYGANLVGTSANWAATPAQSANWYI